MSELEELKQRRRLAEQLYDQAVKNLGLEPTRSERRNAIFQIIDELKESADSGDGLLTQ